MSTSIKRYLPPEVILPLLAAFLLLSLKSDFGAFWDTGLHLSYGRASLEYLATGNYAIVADVPSVQANIRLYPATTDVIAEGIAKVFSLNSFTSRQVLNTILWCLGMIPVILLAKMYGSPLSGWLAGILLVLSPQYFGQSLFNPKDIPAAVAVAWFIWSACTKKPLVLQSLLFGFCLATRPGLIFYGLFLLPSVFYALQSGKRGYAVVFFGAALAYGTMICLWPYAHTEPWRAPLEAILHSGEFDDMPIPTKYFGEVYTMATIPWHYLFGYFLVTLPIPLLLGLLYSIPNLLARKKALLLLAALGLPLLLVLLLQPPLYSGTRHFLFLNPLICAIVGAGVLANPSKLRILVAIIGVLLMTKDAVQMHPYQSIYYNELVKEPHQFDLDVHVSGFRGAAEYLNEIAGPADKIIVSAGNWGPYAFSMFYKYPENVQAIPPEDVGTLPEHMPENFRYFVGSSAMEGFDQVYVDNPVAHEENRMGIPIYLIRENQRH